MSEHIYTEQDGYLLIITLARPEKLNSVTPEMAEALISIVDNCNSDDSVRCVIFTGTGDKAFCAGSDIRTLDNYDTPWNFRNRRDYCDALRHATKPVIAAVNGYAFGGGFETAMSCDIRLASKNASFAAPEVKLGWIGGGGMAAHLTHTIGSSNAAMMIMTGDSIDAHTALNWGLVSRVVDRAELLSEAKELGHTIAERAPIATETAKVNLRAAYGMNIEDAITYERDLQTICFATEDAAEGREAFKQKRAPLFNRR